MKAKTEGQAKPKYIDRPEVSEVFADRLEHLFFDGATVRMEFTVTRTDPATTTASGQPAKDGRQWAYTASRIVLSARGAAEMLNMMRELHGLMLQQGYIQPQASEPAAQPPALVQSGAPVEPPK